MIRALLAALALACVCSPAVAAECSPEAANWPLGITLIVIGAMGMAFAIWRDSQRAKREMQQWADYLRKPCWLACIAYGAAALLLIGGSPASAETVVVNGQPTVILPWGDWIAALAVALREPILTVLLPIVAGYLIQAIRRVYPWATLFLSQRRVEMMLEAAVGYGLNAVQGAAKGKTLSAQVAVPVIAKGAQYVIDTAPPAVIKAAGGADGIAARMFRKLDLDEHASERNVLVPALDKIGGFAPPSAEELSDADRMARG